MYYKIKILCVKLVFTKVMPRCTVRETSKFDENDLQIGYLSAEYLEHKRETPTKENVNSHRQNSYIQD
jgi:hypothetical protein